EKNGEIWHLVQNTYSRVQLQNAANQGWRHLMGGVLFDELWGIHSNGVLFYFQSDPEKESLSISPSSLRIEGSALKYQEGLRVRALLGHNGRIYLSPYRASSSPPVEIAPFQERDDAWVDFVLAKNFPLSSEEAEQYLKNNTFGKDCGVEA